MNIRQTRGQQQLFTHARARAHCGRRRARTAGQPLPNAATLGELVARRALASGDAVLLEFVDAPR